MKRLIIAALVVIPVTALSYWAVECPCDQTPGLYLRGVEAEAQVTDWAFANQGGEFVHIHGHTVFSAKQFICGATFCGIAHWGTLPLLIWQSA